MGGRNIIRSMRIEEAGWEGGYMGAWEECVLSSITGFDWVRLKGATGGALGYSAV